MELSLQQQVFQFATKLRFPVDYRGMSLDTPNQLLGQRLICLPAFTFARSSISLIDPFSAPSTRNCSHSEITGHCEDWFSVQGPELHPMFTDNPLIRFMR